MRRVTLDSNIYVSGFVFGGQPKRLLEMANDRDIHLAVSGPISEEVQRVLMRKFGWSEVRASDVRGMVRTYAEWVEPKEELDVVKERRCCSRRRPSNSARMKSGTLFARVDGRLGEVRGRGLEGKGTTHVIDLTNELLDALRS